MNDDIRAQHDAMEDAYTQYLWGRFVMERTLRAWRTADRVILHGCTTIRLEATPLAACPVRRVSGGVLR